MLGTRALNRGQSAPFNQAAYFGRETTSTIINPTRSVGRPRRPPTRATVRGAPTQINTAGLPQYYNQPGNRTRSMKFGVENQPYTDMPGAIMNDRHRSRGWTNLRNRRSLKARMLGQPMGVSHRTTSIKKPVTPITATGSAESAIPRVLPSQNNPLAASSRTTVASAERAATTSARRTATASAKTAVKDLTYSKRVIKGLGTRNGMIGLGIGLGAFAFTRNTASASPKPQSRPTGMYQY